MIARSESPPQIIDHPLEDVSVLLLDADLAPNATGVVGVAAGFIASHRGLV
ncbi:MAG TPA: hypothetical protein VEF72_10770 [Mycobacterium sp.]|nr:hypothetical protein [Mycobacterium sp.]